MDDIEVIPESSSTAGGDQLEIDIEESTTQGTRSDLPESITRRSTLATIWQSCSSLTWRAHADIFNGGDQLGESLLDWSINLSSEPIKPTVQAIEDIRK